MLRDVMQQRNISQAAMARMANINQTQFNRAYNGLQEFFPSWRKRISEVLNMTEVELFDIPEQRRK
jgi:transcriptional regulator with XRE-family HTH domain